MTPEAVMAVVDAFRPSGMYAPIVTPFGADEALDEERLASHIEFVLDNGVAGVVPIGGCGEYVNLLPHERKRVVELAVQFVAGRVPVVAGALAPGTREAIDIGCAAARVGASALLLLPPYYIRPSNAGIVGHFRTVAEATGLPVVVYNNPPRTGVSIDADLLAELADVPGVVAVKDCDRDLASITTKIERLGARMALLGGDDDLVYQVLLSGGHGAIMAHANLAPRMCVDLYEACARGDTPAALALNRAMLPLIQVRQGPNHPGPLKELMAMAGSPVGPARRPLLGMTERQRQQATTLLKRPGETH
jgi:4-hydroxy-tetrahydrodipicolinate synthase